MSPSGKISEAMVEATLAERAANALIRCADILDKNDFGHDIRFEVRDIAASLLGTLAALSVPTPGTGGAEETCERCQGNGEIVTDWDRYLGPAQPGDTGDEGTEACADCDGTGHGSIPPTLGTAKVRPLEWREEPIPPSWKCLASSCVGLYCIPLGRGTFVLRFRDKDTLGEFASLEAAKAAAQRDFESRILSAISSSPVGEMVLVPRDFIEFVKSAPVDSGVCCCGDEMATHPEPMSCGHTPVDQWHYSLSLWLDQIGGGR